MPITQEEKNQLIQTLETSLLHMALEDIKRASGGGSKMGAFILCSCYIDYLAGFRYGKPAGRSEYKQFVTEYLKMYDPEAIYHDMRCGIVHNYTEGGSYIFMHEHPELHRYQQAGVGKICLNLEDFISDIESAALKYMDELMNIESHQELAKQRLNAGGVLQITNHI